MFSPEISVCGSFSRLTPTRMRPLRFFLLLLAVFAWSGTVQAQTKERVLFPNSVAPLPPEAAPTAQAVPAARLQDTIEFEIPMRMRDYPKLIDRIGRGEVIAPAELDRAYLPLPQDYAVLLAWLKAQGFVVTQTEANRLSVFVRGTIVQIQDEFQVQMAEVIVGGERHHAPRTAPSLPANIATGVLGFNGLQTYLKAHKNIIAAPAATRGNAPPFKIGDILAAYNAAGLAATGVGQTIAILIDTTPKPSDLTSFWTQNGVSQSLSNITTINVTGVTLAPPEGEETLDVSWASGIASGAKVRVYASGSLQFSDLDKSLQRIISDLPSQPGMKQLSISLGLGETYLIGTSQMQTDSQYFATIASNGVSIFVSTGDAGSNPDGTGHSTGGPLQVEYFASDPSVTGVGGTSLFEDPNGGAVTNETGWTDSGGGVSRVFQRPVWQSGAGVPIGNKRCLPDVSSAADPNTAAFLILNGGLYPVGGTSWSAPTWAGFCALINQSRAASSEPPLGLLNPLIYPLIGTNNFRDITRGNNGQYNATAKYDLVTGIGVPDVANLLATLVGSSTATPTITGFSPVVGAPGTVVTITGVDLAAATSVNFSGTPGAVSSNTATQIVVTVPAGATTGLITVVTPNGTATSSSNFYISTGVPNDFFAAPQAISGDSGSVTGTNLGGSKEAGEPNHAGNAGGSSAWYVWTAPQSAVYTFDTFNSSFDTLLAIYTGNAVNALTEVASNDDAGTAVTSEVSFVAVAGTVYHIAVDGHLSEGGTVAEGTIKLAWFLNSALPAINSFSPETGGPGTIVGINGANFLGASNVSFNGLSALFTVNSTLQLSATVPAGATTGLITITTPAGTATSTAVFVVVTAPPPNDAFANATLLGGASGSEAGSNIAGTKEPGEPNHAGDPGGHSVWYSWTAQKNGVYTFNTTGSSFDSLLAIYTGTTVSTLTQVAANDDFNGGITSSASFSATAGSTFYIAVDGFGGATGNIALNWMGTLTPPVVTSFSPASGSPGGPVTITGTGFMGATNVAFQGTPAMFIVNSDTQITATVPQGAVTGAISVTTINGTSASANSFTITAGPANDNFASAFVIPAAGGTVNVSNAGATRQGSEPKIAGNPGGASVWWNWTPSASGVYTVSTAGSSFDTLLGIYTGSAVSNLATIGANDNTPLGGVTSSLTFQATAGTTYQIVVDGSNGATGSIVLTVGHASGTTILFATNFEAAQNYSTSSKLAGVTVGGVQQGQNGWMANGLTPSKTGFPSTGIALNSNQSQFGVGQEAFIGGSTAVDKNGLFVWQPINYTPVANDIIAFSVDALVSPTSNGKNDRFAWVVTNVAGLELFEVDFDNAIGGIYYTLDDLSGPATNIPLLRNHVYHLQVVMDFPNNLWSATVDETVLARDQPITNLKSARNLGHVDALWLPVSASAGTNQMIFDNYTIVKSGAGAATPPQIVVEPQSQTAFTGDNVALKVIAIGNGKLTYQWYKGGTQITGAVGPTLLLPAVQPPAAGSYTVIVTNTASQTATSTAATLTINQPPAAFTVSATVSPAGSGSVSGAAPYPSGGNVTITAIPMPGYAFATWTENGVIVSRSASYSFAVTQNRNLVANFENSFTTFLSAYLSPAQFSNPGDITDSAILGGDGIANLMKYALALDPANPAPVAALPRVSTASGFLTLSYTKNEVASGITYVVEVSSNLVTWNSGSGFTSAPVVTNANGSTETVTVSDLTPVNPASAPDRYIRLRVTSP